MSNGNGLFEIATREKFRFYSAIGMLTVEQLWELPLTTTSDKRPSLDNVARAIDEDLAKVSKSFVESKSDPAKTKLTLMLDVVKYIIATKIEENAKQVTAAKKKEQKAFLVELLHKKQTEKLGELSVDEINKMIAELN
jgi:hypothetical protein